jgi:predicted glycogen debranching enzyme
MFHREWLVTNGTGSYASGTVSDVLTRRYHGLLVAALEPPLGRRVLLAKLEATATYHGLQFDLAANRWRDDSLSPRGFDHLRTFTLEGSVPVWHYAFANAIVERRVWMEGGADTTYVRYTLVDADAPLTLSLKALVNDRDFHSLTHAYDIVEAAVVAEQRARIRLRDTGQTWHLAIDCGTIVAANDWYYGFLLEAERERGLDYLEDHLHAATITATLAPGSSLTIGASLTSSFDFDGTEACDRACDADERALADFHASRPHHANAPKWIEQLALAADQFIVNRGVDGSLSKTVIAGYHWFGDWGRDTMIALPGLTLTTGRAQIARSILETFAHFVSEGMLPNRFPDGGSIPEYNTVDATLWFIEAIRAYVEATGDATILSDTYDTLCDIVEWHVRGTRYGIVMDGDGLIRAGERGVQLTWMDAKVGDWVVTPRIGKPVEINALWYNALCAIDSFAQHLGKANTRVRELGTRARASFARFWNPSNGYLYDVLDGPDGQDDDAIRPNAIIAISLPFRALDQNKERSVIDVASRTLLTPFGLRSLDPAHPAYVGTYAGDVAHRDGAYHQGTVWPWLIGPYIRAFTNAYGTSEPMQHQLELWAAHLHEYAHGTLAEIADGDAPHHPRGCIAQAWSVAEALRSWSDLHCHPEHVEGTKR